MSSFSMGDLIPLIQQESVAQGMDPATVIAHFIAENTSDGKLDPKRKVSLTTQGITPETGKPSGALGLFQIVPTTLKGLMRNGLIPANLDYNTLEGQIKAGVAAVKEAQQVAANRLGKPDVYAGAAQYVNGNAGLQGYLGTGAMPAQAAGYLKKIAAALGEGSGPQVASWGRENRTPTPIPPDSSVVADKSSTTVSSMLKASGDSVDEFKKIAASNLELLKAMGVNLDAATQQATQASQETAAATTAAAQAAAAREADKLRRDQNVISVFGLDAASKDSALIADMAKQASQQQVADSLKPQIDSLMAMDPLTNPIKWIAAQFQLGSLVPKYNAAIQNRNQLRSNIDSQIATATAVQQITPAITLDTIHREMQAKSQLAAAAAKADAARFTAENINAHARFISEEMQWAAQTSAMSASQARLYMESVGIAKDEEAKKDEQAMLDRINRVRLSYGAPAISLREFKFLPKDQQEALINANPSPASPGEGILNLKQFGDVNALSQQQGNTAMSEQVNSIMDKVKQKYDQERMMNARGEKPDETLKRVINDQYKVWRAEIASGDMTRASSDNPYRINAVQASQTPGLEANSIALWVKDTAKTLPADSIKEKEILSQAIGQIAAGVSVDKVANDVAEFYSKGYEYQFKSRGLGTLGFDSNTYQGKKYYGVHSDVFGFWQRMFGAPSVNKPIDLTNATSVKHFLIETTVKAQARSPSTALTGRGDPNLQGQIEYLQRETGASQ